MFIYNLSSFSEYSYIIYFIAQNEKLYNNGHIFKKLDTKLDTKKQGERHITSPLFSFHIHVISTLADLVPVPDHAVVSRCSISRSIFTTILSYAVPAFSRVVTRPSSAEISPSASVILWVWSESVCSEARSLSP